MKRVMMVIVMACILFPAMVFSYTNIETMGSIEPREIGDISNQTTIILKGRDGVVPKDEYVAEWDMMVETPVTIEAGTIIHFTSASGWSITGLFIVSSLTFEPGCALDAINITDSAQPVWGGIQVREGGVLRADGLTLKNVPEDWKQIQSFRGDIYLTNKTSIKGIWQVGGKFSADGAELMDVGFGENSQIDIRNSLLHLGDGSTSFSYKGIHIYFPESRTYLGFNGRAILYLNNRWEGDKGMPLIGLVGSGDTVEATSDPKKLAELNILIQPPTAVEQRTWGEIKRLFH